MEKYQNKSAIVQSAITSQKVEQLLRRYLKNKYGITDEAIDNGIYFKDRSFYKDACSEEMSDEEYETICAELSELPGILTAEGVTQPVLSVIDNLVFNNEKLVEELMLEYGISTDSDLESINHFVDEFESLLDAKFNKKSGNQSSLPF